MTGRTVALGKGAVLHRMDEARFTAMGVMTAQAGGGSRALTLVGLVKGCIPAMAGLTELLHRHGQKIRATTMGLVAGLAIFLGRWVRGWAR